MTEQIKITITPDGMKIDAEGFTGGKCLKVQEDLEKFMQNAGISATGKQQKKKLELMYETAPGNFAKY